MHFIFALKIERLKRSVLIKSLKLQFNKSKIENDVNETKYQPINNIT